MNFNLIKHKKKFVKKKSKIATKYTPVLFIGRGSDNLFHVYKNCNSLCKNQILNSSSDLSKLVKVTYKEKYDKDTDCFVCFKNGFLKIK